MTPPDPRLIPPGYVPVRMHYTQAHGHNCVGRGQPDTTWREDVGYVWALVRHQGDFFRKAPNRHVGATSATPDLG